MADSAGPVPRRWIQLAMWIWLVVVLAAAGAFLHRHLDVVQAMFAQLSAVLLIGSTGFLFAAKLLLAENARLAAARFGAASSYAFFFRAYNLSQLGKYLPGSIWQFVSRYAMYRANTLSPKQSRDAMIAETAWALGGACVAGLLVLTRPAPNTLMEFIGGLSTAQVVWLLVGGVTVVAAVAALWGMAGIRGQLLEYRPSARVFVLQLLTWFALGVSFWLLLIASTDYMDGLLYAVGVFGLAYAAGFFVPFAPAGIGVREAVMVATLSGPVTMEEAVVLAVMARVLYILVELVLAGASMVTKRRDQGAAI